jgi:hypothetical protein
MSVLNPEHALLHSLAHRMSCTPACSGLLRTLSMHLTSSLVKLDMGVVRIMREEALEGITQLNRLTDLRLAVTVCVFVYLCVCM